MDIADIRLDQSTRKTSELVLLQSGSTNGRSTHALELDNAGGRTREDLSGPEERRNGGDLVALIDAAL